MMMKASFVFVLSLLALVSWSVECGTANLRRLDQDDSPAASPTEDQDASPAPAPTEDRESEPAAGDVVFDPPAPTPAPTPAPDTNEEAPTNDDGDDNDEGEDDEDDDEDDWGGDEDEDDNTEPTPAPSGGADDNGGGGDTEDATPTDAPAGDEDTTPETTPGGDDEGTVPETTQEADAGDTEGGETEGGGTETSVPTIAPKTEITPEPTSAPKATPEPTVAEAPADTPTEESPAAGDSPTQDGDEDDEDYDPWENYTPPTEKPVVYVPPDDDTDPMKNETNTPGGGSWIQEGETPEEMIHDRNVLIAVGVICGVGILLMVITAHQMVENPDGCCASVCRLIVGCTCCIFRTICYPCRAMCGCTRNKRRARQHQMLSDNGNYTHDLELS